MAFAEIELARIEKIVGGFCRAKTNHEFRNELRLEYSVNRHDVEIYEVRPDWMDPSKEMHTPVAKVKYVRTANEWRLYWMRADLKWHRYEPFEPTRDLQEIVDAVGRDEYCCFFG